MLFLGPKAAASQKEEMDRLKAENVHLQSEIHLLNSKMEVLQNQINNSKKEKENLQSENEKLTKQADEQRTERIKLQGQIRLLQLDNEKLKSDIDNEVPNPIKWEYERLKCEVSGLRKLLEEKKTTETVTNNDTDTSAQKPLVKETTIKPSETVKPAQTIKREIPINKNVDEALSGAEAVKITLTSPIPPRVWIEKPPSLAGPSKLTREVRNGDYTAFDLETNGFNKEVDIIEISAVRFRGFQAVKTFTSFVKPTAPVPKEITELTGIRNEDVIDAPVFEELLAGFTEFVGTDAIIGHNLKSFDMVKICQRGFNAQVPKRAYFDTYTIAKRLMKNIEIENYRLETLVKYFGFTRSASHRAESDSAATGLLFALLMSMAEKQGCMDNIS